MNIYVNTHLIRLTGLILDSYHPLLMAPKSRCIDIQRESFENLGWQGARNKSQKCYPKWSKFKMMFFIIFLFYFNLIFMKNLARSEKNIFLPFCYQGMQMLIPRLSKKLLKVLDLITFLTTRLTSTLFRFWNQQMVHILVIDILKFYIHSKIGYLRRNN